MLTMVLPWSAAMRTALAFVLALTAVAWCAPAMSAGALAAQPPGSGLAGMLLVAEPALDDPNFDHTIVLVLEHDAKGALGLVVNRPYGTAPTAELLRRLGVDADGAPAATGETLLFYGGPVQPDVGMVVHSTDYARKDTRRVTAEIAVTVDPAALADLALGKGPRRAVSVLGYAGWAAGQLESELAAGSWFTLPADPALVFAPDPTRAWEAAFARKGVDL
jgi:putative transcriptional regulator